MSLDAIKSIDHFCKISIKIIFQFKINQVKLYWIVYTS